MSRLSLFCILLVIVIAYLKTTDAASRIARSPQYRKPYGLPPPPPPPPRGFGPGCDPYGPPGRFDRGPGRFDHGPGRFDHGPGRFDHGPGRFDHGPERFDRGPSHHGHGHHDRENYDVPPGGSISISKTISISSGGNAQSSAGSSAGSGGTNAAPGGSSATSNAESSASGK